MYVADKVFHAYIQGIKLPKYHKSWDTGPKNCPKMFTLNIMDMQAITYKLEGGRCNVHHVVVVVISKGFQVGHEKPKS